MNLICQDISFGYSSGAPIFSEYTKEFPVGITVLKGYSGCGKTTLLKLLAGYLTVQSGKIMTPTGHSVTGQTYRKRHVSYMFQGINLLPLASVERNLRLCAEMAMLKKSEWQPRATQLLERLGLSDLHKKKANSLSGGQAQRAALARTLMKNSSVLLLDEPTSGLDDQNTETIKRIVEQEGQNKICIISTHDSRLFDLAHEIIDFDQPVSC